tara:strand:+ start:717 stop:1298 length:582 start_codon:yes stop_codon:yes gene_type:complete
MPIIEKINNNNCRIAVWKTRESLSELIELAEELDTRYISNDKRKKEYLVSRVLLKKMRLFTEITYNSYGAPEIKDNNFISISHSKDLTAIIISKKKVGLDIEKISKKALKLSSKFIKKKTHIPLSKDKATLIWCCKEAIYKWHQEGNVNFSNDIIISPFIVQQEGSLNAEFKQTKLTLYYKKIKTHFLVYVCK